MWKNNRWSSKIATYDSRIISKLINGKKHFHYNEIKFYKLKGIDKFFEALENGDIRIYFCLGVYKSGFKKGLEHDHGVTFGIKESDLCKLYEEVK